MTGGILLVFITKLTAILPFILVSQFGYCLHYPIGVGANSEQEQNPLAAYDKGQKSYKKYRPDQKPPGLYPFLPGLFMDHAFKHCSSGYVHWQMVLLTGDIIPQVLANKPGRLSGHLNQSSASGAMAQVTDPVIRIFPVYCSNPSDPNYLA